MFSAWIIFFGKLAAAFVIAYILFGGALYDNKRN